VGALAISSHDIAPLEKEMPLFQGGLFFKLVQKDGM